MGWLRKLWHWLASPSRGVAAGLLLVAGGLAGVLFWGGFNAAIQFTNRTEFCVSCHEMSTVYAEYQKTVHFQNASGVRAGCPDCHVPRGWAHELVAKIKATNELYYKVTGKISTPEKFEAHRLELAKSVWAKMEATDSRECRNCHSFAAMDPHKQTEAGATAMQKAAAEGQTCISCHKGIAHQMPDMAQGYRQSLADLQAEAAKIKAKPGDVLYPLTTKPLFIARPSNADDPPDGRLIAATPVKVLAVEGDWLQVEVGGWQQQGAERMIYTDQGKRIFAAALGPPAVEKVQQGEGVTDKDTDQVWSPATLTAWVGKDGLITDQKKLWAYGEEMYGAACGGCHAPHPTTHYLANQWIGSVTAMAKRTSLNDEEVRFLQKYLQLHAKDTASQS